MIKKTNHPHQPINLGWSVGKTQTIKKGILLIFFTCIIVLLVNNF